MQGAEAALRAIAQLFGAKLVSAVPRVWVHASAALLQRAPGEILKSPPNADAQVTT